VLGMRGPPVKIGPLQGHFPPQVQGNRLIGEVGRKGSGKSQMSVTSKHSDV
jgi:hypothetical protein